MLLFATISSASAGGFCEQWLRNPLAADFFDKIWNFDGNNEKEFLENLFNPRDRMLGKHVGGVTTVESRLLNLEPHSTASAFETLGDVTSVVRVLPDLISLVRQESVIRGDWRISQSIDDFFSYKPHQQMRLSNSPQLVLSFKTGKIGYLRSQSTNGPSKMMYGRALNAIQASSLAWNRATTRKAEYVDPEGVRVVLIWNRDPSRKPGIEILTLFPYSWRVWDLIKADGR